MQLRTLTSGLTVTSFARMAIESLSSDVVEVPSTRDHWPSLQPSETMAYIAQEFFCAMRGLVSVLKTVNIYFHDNVQAYLEDSVIKNESFFHSATISDFNVGTDRNIRSNLGRRIDVSCLVDETRLDNGRAAALMGRS